MKRSIQILHSITKFDYMRNILLYKKLKQGYFSFLFLWMLCVPAFGIAQESGADKVFVFSGKIVDESGNAIEGVEMKIKRGKILTLSHPDYLYKQVKLTSKDFSNEDLKIVMTERYLKNTTTLDRPYGVVDKESYLGSASTIYTNQLTSDLSATIIPSFAGQLPGLYVEQYAGTKAHLTSAGSGWSLGGFIPVFGAGNYSDNSQFVLSARGNNPVVMVDGIQRELFSINPEAIESVSIQKDALSSMLLGMRSSRGILAITTKNLFPKDLSFLLLPGMAYRKQSICPKHCLLINMPIY